MKKLLLAALLCLPIVSRGTVRGYYPGNSGDSQITDHSGFGNNLSTVGTLPNPSLPTPPEGNLWLFQGPAGQTTYMLAPSGAYNSGVTGQMSLYFYVQTTSTAASAIMSVDDGLDLADHTGFETTSGGKLLLSYTTVAGAVTSATAATVNDGASHLIWFRSGNFFGTQLYVDGVIQINDPNPSIFGVFGQIVLGQETLNTVYTKNNTYVDSVQIGDSTSDAFLGPQTPDTPTFTPTITNTFTASPTPTFTPTITATDTPTRTITSTFTFSPTITHTFTTSPTPAWTHTPTPTNSPNYSPTPTATPTWSPIGTLTATPTPTVTFSFSPTYTPVATSTPLSGLSTESNVQIDIHGNVLLTAKLFQDGYVNPAIGPSHDLLGWYTKFVSAQVVGTGAQNETYSVDIQGSLDNSSWVTLATLSSSNPLSKDRMILSPQSASPINMLYIRSSVTSFSAVSTTGITVNIVAGK